MSTPYFCTSILSLLLPTLRCPSGSGVKWQGKRCYSVSHFQLYCRKGSPHLSVHTQQPPTMTSSWRSVSGSLHGTRSLFSSAGPCAKIRTDHEISSKLFVICFQCFAMGDGALPMKAQLSAAQLCRWGQHDVQKSHKDLVKTECCYSEGTPPSWPSWRVAERRRLLRHQRLLPCPLLLCCRSELQPVSSAYTPGNELSCPICFKTKFIGILELGGTSHRQ